MAEEQEIRFIAMRETPQVLIIYILFHPFPEFTGMEGVMDTEVMAVIIIDLS